MCFINWTLHCRSHKHVLVIKQIQSSYIHMYTEYAYNFVLKYPITNFPMARQINLQISSHPLAIGNPTELNVRTILQNQNMKFMTNMILVGHMLKCHRLIACCSSHVQLLTIIHASKNLLELSVWQIIVDQNYPVRFFITFNI